MNSQILVPERQIYPYVSTSQIRPFVDSYTYRPASMVFNIPRETYKYIKTSNSVSTIDVKKFHNHFKIITPSANFLNWY